MRHLLILSLLCLAACGYHFEGGGEKIAISVPYVQGDPDGFLTDTIIRSIGTTPQFRYSHGIGDWTLKVTIVGVNENRIGFQYDRNYDSGKIRTNIVAVENRKEVTAEVTLINNCTGKILFGPQIVKADAEYDYVDPNSLKELSFTDEEGDDVATVRFSLGQLDSIEGAQVDACVPAYVALAKKIVDGLIIFNEP